MVGILVSFKDGVCSGAMLVLGSVHLWKRKIENPNKDDSIWRFHVFLKDGLQILWDVEYKNSVFYHSFVAMDLKILVLINSTNLELLHCHNTKESAGFVGLAPGYVCHETCIISIYYYMCTYLYMYILYKNSDHVLLDVLC